MNRPIKVMRIIARLNVGGPALHCLLLSKGLTKRGFDTILVTGSPEVGEASFEELFQVPVQDFRLVKLSRLRRMVSLAGDVKTFFQLLFLMLKERPDIVHTHTAKAGVLGRSAAFVARVPVRLHTFHGHVLSGYFSPLLSKFVCLTERLLARATTAVVTLSPELKKELSEKFSVTTKEKIHVVPLGRDLSPFLENELLKGRVRTELGITADTVLISHVGRLVPIKDHATLFHSLALLPPHLKWRCLVIGRGPLEEPLKQLAETLNLHSKIHFLGWRNDLAALYADTDIVALTSRNEGTPLSIIEAFASGRPVIATAVGGVPDLFHPVEEKKAGISYNEQREGALVAPGDEESLTAALKLFIEEG